MINENNLNPNDYYGFIYITTNKANNKKYIGQKIFDKENKWKKYLGSGLIFKKAVKKYGINNFSREIIEQCLSKKELDEKEIYWINYYDAINSEEFYNIAEGGDGGDTTAGYTKEQKEALSKKRSKALKGKINQGKSNPNAKQVICLNNMKVFDTSVEASAYCGVSSGAIQNCCNYRSYTAGKDPITHERLQWEYYYPDKQYKLKETKRKKNTSDSKKIICYTTKEVFNSCKEASVKYNLSENGIGQCCKFEYSYFGKLEDGTQLQWFYYDYYLSDGFDINNHPIKDRRKIYTIFMYDLNGNFEKEFSSQKEANEYVGNHINGSGRILQCCRGERKNIYGHSWRFYKVDKLK